MKPSNSESYDRPKLSGFVLALCIVLVSSGLVREPHETAPLPALERADGFTEMDAELSRFVGSGETKSAERSAGEQLRLWPRSCTAYSLIAESARQSGKLPELAEKLRQATIAFPDRPELVFAQGVTLQFLEDGPRTRNLFTEAVSAGAPCGGAYVGFVRIHRKLGSLDLAEAVLREQSRLRPRDPFLLFAAAFLLEMRGESGRALGAYRLASIIAPPLAVTLLRQAGLLLRRGKVEEAIRVSRTGLALARRSKAVSLEIRFLGLMSKLFYLNGDDSASSVRFDQAIATARDYGFGVFEAELLLDRAGLVSANGALAEWEELVRRAETISNDHWSVEDRARWLNGLSRSRLEVGEHDTAAAYAARAYEAARAAEDPFQLMDVSLQLAYLSMSAGETARALEASEAVLDRALQLSDGYRQGIALSALGTIYEHMGGYDRSMKYYGLALSWAERDGDLHNQALALGNLALTHMRAGHSGPALVFAARAVDETRSYRNLRLQTTLQQGLAAAFAGLGDLEEAARVYQGASALAAELGDPELQSMVLSGQGRVLLGLGREERARRSFETALELTTGRGNPLVRLQSISGLGLCHWFEGELVQAEHALRRSLDLVETSRESILRASDRLSYLETRSQIYANLSAILTELDERSPGEGYDERAFAVVEQSRARMLLDILDGAEPTEAGLSMGRRKDDLLSPSVLALSRRGLLKDGDVLAEFELGERQSTLWLVRAEGLRWYRLPPRRVIEAETQRLLRSIRQPPRLGLNPPAQHRRPARELFEMLLGPVAQELSTATRLIVSPDGALHHVPFEVLLHEGPDGSERYLVESLSLSYIPSISVLRDLGRRADAGVRDKVHFLGVAQPAPAGSSVGQSPQLGMIPFAAEEVDALGELFRPDERRLLVGATASELAVKEENLAQFRILHFAAHARADQAVPERSAIRLGADQHGREDGILHMSEVMRLSLDADLVVLSGCETGVGQLLRAEGTLGFTWAFLSAGSSSVAVSLWNVNDRSTSVVMKRFYEEMRRGASFGDALAESKRAMLRSSRQAYRHPYYWAPFVLVGLSEGRAWEPPQQ